MKNTAVILIGFQNDYFSNDGILSEVVKETVDSLGILDNTLELVRRLSSECTVISTPIVFSENYHELVEPIGILKSIKELGAFKKGTNGSDIIPELKDFGERIIHIEGKHGLNAFTDTHLESYLRENNIEHIVLAGCVCSICIDSTGRSAFDRGFRVTMLSDCITGRTIFEQKFYCEEIFPLYSRVINSLDFLNECQNEG